MSPRRSSAFVLVGVVVAVASVALPLAVHNRQPEVVGLVAGLVLLACGADLVGAAVSRMCGLLLVGASIAWFAPDLAVTGNDVVDRVLAATSLVHVPLLVSAVLVVPRGRLGGSLALAAAGCASLAALSAVTGGYRILLGVTGPVLVVAVLHDWWILPRRASRPGVAFLAAGVLFGSTVAAGSIVRLATGASTEARLALLYTAVVAVVPILLVSVGPWLRASYAVDVGRDGLAAFDAMVAEVTGDPDAHASVRTGPDTWVNLHGQPDVCAPDLRVELGQGEAIDFGALTVHREDRDPLLAEGLALAARNVRLRRAAAEHVEELAALRQRLVAVDDDERAALVARLRIGPLALLQQLESDLREERAADTLITKVERTQAALSDLARGLEPLARGRGLRESLEELLSTSPTDARLTWAATEPAPAVARVLWFAASEALVNAAKHAPGSRVRMTVADESDVVRLEVSDDGPGGARLDGSGLRGVRDRAEVVAGTVDITSGDAGTCLTVRVPTGIGTGQHVVRTRDGSDASGALPVLASRTPTREVLS